jgi:hypothetical protein
MSNVESTTDMLRNRVAEALVDGNGLPPTRAALDVIMAVVRATDRTDENTATAMGWAFTRRVASAYEPSLTRYALDAERILRVLRKNHR